MISISYALFMRCIGEEIERLDAALAGLAREEAALRLRLGQVLEMLSRGGVFELGFSSVAAYALERCDRSARWAEATRCLARRLENLPGMRRAIATGKVSWSMGELLARAADREDEARWLELAESRTVRQMRVLVAQAVERLGNAASVKLGSHAAVGECNAHSVPGPRVATASAVTPAAGGDTAGVPAEVDDSDGCEEMCTLTCTVNREDAWLFEATRSLMVQLGVHGADDQIEALLAEGQGTLLAALPQGAIDPDGWQSCDTARQRWLSELERWRAEAEALCEQNIRGCILASRGHGPGATQGGVIAAAAVGMASLEHATCRMLDAEVRALADVLARHELDFSSLLLRFHRAEGWRRLGYATETQYARERLGLSRSSVQARRLLAARLERLPGLTASWGAGQIGVEATLQVARVATARTEAAWVARAQKRTIKHLREEVAAALAAVRWSGEVDCLPPLDAELAAFQALEQAVVSGRVCRAQSADAVQGTRTSSSCAVDMARLSEPASEQRRAWFVMLGSLAQWLDRGLQMSAEGTPATGSHATSGVGRVTLRLRMSRANYTAWRGLEAQSRAWLPRGMSWLRFLCLSLWQAWRHLLGGDVAYGQIYIRDRYRCTSPVCSRRDVTPHHLRFRSAGGSDDDDNVASVCTWCHLHGIHGGRIRASGTARLIHWELGAPASPCLVVHGRERVTSLSA